MPRTVLYIIALTFTFIFFQPGIYVQGQNVDNVVFINELSQKREVTFGEAVKFYVLTLGKNPGSFNNNINILKSSGIADGLDYSESSKIRKGTLSLMIAEHLDLGDSLIFMLLKFERYAFRVCIANNIIDYDASEWDTISGGELIEVMTKVSEKMSGKD